MKHNVSLIIIAHNEAHIIPQCLDSVNGLVNEIVAVINDCTDQTKELLSSYGAKVYEQKWLGFGLQKNFAVSKSSNDWVLCLDADEIITEKLKQEILLALENPNVIAYKLNRKNKFLGKYLNYGAGYPDYSIRLFNKNYANWSHDVVHERVVLLSDGNVGRLDNFYLHDSCETLDKYLSKQNAYTTIQAHEMFNNKKKFKPIKLFFSPIVHIIKYGIFKLGFLDGVSGIIHIITGAFNSFQKQAKLYSLYKNEK